METKYIKIDFSGSGVTILRLTGWLSLTAGIFTAAFTILSNPSIESIWVSVISVLGGAITLGICQSLATITESAVYLKEHIKNNDENTIYQEDD